MRLWFDLETCELVTEECLRDEYESKKKEGWYVGETFEDYLGLCLFKENGTLFPVRNAELFVAKD